jgi:hypothetical protein
VSTFSAASVEADGPKRIQLSRKKGWRKPVLAAVVSRPGYFGNPFVVREATPAEWDPPFGGVYVRDRAHAVELLREYLAWRKAQGPGWHRTTPGPNFPWESQIRQLLRGRDLCCWCPLDEPCHADVLLEIANRMVVSFEPLTDETT